LLVVAPFPFNRLMDPSVPFGPGEALPTLAARGAPVTGAVPGAGPVVARTELGLLVVAPFPFNRLMDPSVPFGPGEALPTLAARRPPLPVPAAVAPVPEPGLLVVAPLPFNRLMDPSVPFGPGEALPILVARSPPL